MKVKQKKVIIMNNDDDDSDCEDIKKQRLSK